MKIHFTLKVIPVILLTVAAGAQFASATSRAKPAGVVSDAGFAGNPATLGKELGIERSRHRLSADGVAQSEGIVSASFGGGASQPSFFLDYSYINVDDERSGFPGGATNSISLGMDVFTQSEMLVGLIYSYSDTDLDGSVFDSSSDSNFLTGYVSKSIQPWLQVGMTAGWGHTDTNSTGSVNVETGTWTLSPFTSVVWANGPLFASGTLAYQYSKPGGAGSHSFTIETNVGYQLTDALSVVGLIRYFQEMQNDIETNDDENYTTLGVKAYYSLSGTTSLYAGVETDVFNDSYETFSFLTGLSTSF